MKEILLQAKNLKKSYKTPKKIDILKGVDLTIERGETVAIVGRSGQGKSTLLQVLGTLEKPCSGELYIKGEKVTPLNVSHIRNQNLGFIFQSFHLLEDYTVLENVLMPAKIARKDCGPLAPSYQTAMELLDKVHLKDRAFSTTKVLSGGEKQRVALARALCNQPDIILADEPSGNLDKITAKEIYPLLIDFTKNSGRSLIVVTHDPELAELCDKRYTLNDGFIYSDLNLILHI